MTDRRDAHTERPALNGRRAIVTGGTTGIGRAIAVLLASEGVRVFLCGRTADHLADALARVAEVGEGDGIVADLTDRAQFDRFFAAADAWLGGLDIAIVNAASPADGVEGMKEVELRYVAESNFTAYLATAHAALERMEAGSDIVLIGSMSAIVRGAGSSVYVATKAGVEGFADSLRKEVAERDVKVGLVVPGFTGSDFLNKDKYPEEKKRELERAGKLLRAEDVAASVHFMLSQPRRCAVSRIIVEPRDRVE